jgi:predicted nucleic acid-binding protein
MILVDAGPLVALATPEDEHHQQCVEAMRNLPLPFLTTWPVVAEAAWLVTRPSDFMQSVANSCSSRFLEIRHLDVGSIAWIADFMHRYENIRAQLADASLFYLAEHAKIDTIFTLDRRDFSIYRTRKKRALNIIP